MIDRKRKFIFIQIQKTGTVSIRNVLSKGSPEKYEKIHRHSPAFFIKENLKDEFDRYFSFSFVRNPFDKLYSLFSYCKKVPETIDNKNPSFKEWLMEDEWHEQSKKLLSRIKSIKSYQPPIQIRNYEWWLDEDGICIVNFVGKFENLNNDFSIVKSRIGDNSKTLPHLNKSDRLADYREVYDQEMIDFVEYHHANDLARFGYAF